MTPETSLRELSSKSGWPLVRSAVLLALVIAVGDVVVPKGSVWPLELRAGYDELIHGLIAVSIIWPLEGTGSLPRRSLLPLAFLLGGVVDIDHIVAARSFSVYKMFALPMRPPFTHNLIFPVVLLAGFWLFSRRFLSGWILFLALTSHVLRDTFDGRTQLFILGNETHIPFWLYVPGEYLLLVLSYWSTAWKVTGAGERGKIAVSR